MSDKQIDQGLKTIAVVQRVLTLTQPTETRAAIKLLMKNNFPEQADILQYLLDLKSN